MKILLTATVFALFIIPASASAWWNHNNGPAHSANEAWSNNGWYSDNGRYNNDYDGSGDTSGDGSLGFNGDVRFKMKMHGTGNSRIDAYYYDNQGNVWQNGYYYNRYAPNYDHADYRRPNYGAYNKAANNRGYYPGADSQLQNQ